jgi:hypothetical protein
MLPGNSEFTADFFKKSSKAWMENKIRRGQSMAYKCSMVCKNGDQCSRGSIGFEAKFCKQHTKLNKKTR